MHLVHMPTLTFAGIVFNFLFIVSSGCYGQYIHDLNLRCYIIIFGELMFFFRCTLGGLQMDHFEQNTMRKWVA